jgi:antagonist of KipI
MAVIVEHPGTLTTIQDLGRLALRSSGFPSGGAVDTLALRIANLLVGNDENAAALECALVGPRLRFSSDSIVAIAGAQVDELPHFQSFVVRAGQRLDLARLKRETYAYLAISGGIDMPVIMGSRSTDVRLGFGGFHGRALRAGDQLGIGQRATYGTTAGVHVNFASWYDASQPIRVVDGKDTALFDRDWTDHDFRVSAKSDRAGIRLDGTRLEYSKPPADAPSSAVFPGTIQLPGDGSPIVLLADAQTLGGYPQIAHVIRVDLPRMAQFRPGATVRFRRVSIDEAHRLAIQCERQIALLRYRLSLTMSRS